MKIPSSKTFTKCKIKLRVCSKEQYQLYIRSSEEKSNDFAFSGEVNTPFSVAAVATEKQ
jgi:hypothetical protein